MMISRGNKSYLIRLNSNNASSEIWKRSLKDIFVQCIWKVYLAGPYYTGPFNAGHYWRYFSNVHGQTLTDKHITPTLLTPYHEK